MRNPFLATFCACLAATALGGCVPASNTPAGGAPDSGLAEVAVAADGAKTGGDATAAPDVPVIDPKIPVVDLVVDANRDGVAKFDDPGDQDHETTFDQKFGAVFLPNLDDDDQDKLEDWFDDKVNGNEDALDLAPIVVRPWPAAPEGTKGKIVIDKPELVRVWTKVDGEWGLLAGSFGSCDKPENCTTLGEFEFQADWLRTGIELRIEGKQLRMSKAADAWSGDVEIKLSVTLPDGKPAANKDAPDGTDTVKMRVAAWLLLGNLHDHDKWRSLRYGKSSSSYPFNADLDAAASQLAGKAVYETYESSSYADRWTQDFYQTGVVQMPGPGGKPQGYRMYNARPFYNAGGQTLPIIWMRKALLGQDQAILAVYKKPNSGTSYDSHGNHDLVPPYVNAKGDFHHGRIVTGSGVLPETWDWYDAQRVQGPILKLDSSWLIVGHIDEFSSYMPAKTPRGWKLMVGDNKMAKGMFEKAQADGFGKAKVFVGRQGFVNNKQASLEQTVDDVLVNKDILQWSQEADVKVAANVVKMKAEFEMNDDEIVSMPFLTEAEGSKKVAWQPGTVNCLVIGDHAMIPKPFGIIIDGVDVFEKDLLDRLGSAVHGLGSDGGGMKIKFVDDWYGYHINLGEVHCGTNPEMGPSAKLSWWDIAR
ncbi:MAG: hypothetical protein FJ100_17490 [Deltaproteobacteria bacterium]|nr:hypothetical protein [Deltaproteobacteria bacterium]